MPTTEAGAQDSAVVAFARELIRRPSVTPEDAGCQRLLAERLSALGFVIEPMRFGEVDNLWAHFGDSGPMLVFAGHTDVVPTGDVEAWSRSPFSAEVADGMLHGRGAADMKGSLAAMVVAMETLLAEGHALQGRIGFLITSDEEGPARDGTVRVMEALLARGEKIHWCVVGEPSSGAVLGDLVRVGRRGSLNGHLKVRGIQGHVAYPHLARNPVHQALAPLHELASRQWDEGNAFFPPTSFQIANIHAGTGASNVIPGHLDVMFNFRFCTEQTAASLQGDVEAVLDAAGLDYALEWQLSGQPFVTERGRLVEAVCATIEEVSNVTPELSTGGGTSDGRFIAPHGVELVELGPCNATIHQIDECVPVAQLDLLVEAYAGIARRLLT
ncbi:MAG: succinyl-diaminopimelate desuccinylase [Gammaproteobacteria bacterium]|nr:succinyl-diaminopimelate desuccinylase [Gammaproteobacteria bacterium]